MFLTGWKLERPAQGWGKWSNRVVGSNESGAEPKKRAPRAHSTSVGIAWRATWQLSGRVYQMLSRLCFQHFNRWRWASSNTAQPWLMIIWNPAYGCQLLCDRQPWPMLCNLDWLDFVKGHQVSKVMTKLLLDFYCAVWVDHTGPTQYIWACRYVQDNS